VFPETTLKLAEQVIAAAKSQGLRSATVESCTGGLIAAALTSVSGSSDVLDRGFVTYANEAKTEMVGVPAALIQRVGAVSEDVARAMAEGALTHAPVDAAVAVTGIAGPGGGSAEKPVGLVHFAVARKGRATVHVRQVFAGDRAQVRLATVDRALTMLLEALK
jgi:nicotinamide-nucleotide amidase